jgi:hypothetical protein
MKARWGGAFAEQGFSQPNEALMQQPLKGKSFVSRT